ncbi:MAG: hypothetical protein Ct9H300mP16_14850 [Pseudomonadota bacterium]|nr:MAG: hypothetical protein Ct9H300mP16_14850 [Pseudomonadota bacterium]
MLGSHQPLSGPLAGWGVPVTNGLRMRAEEINAAGGIHGRSIRIVVEDTAYSPTKAAQAGSKLINKDKIFAMIGALGTPTNMVTIPMLQKKGLHNLFPLSAARQMYEPLDPLKFSIFAPYYEGAKQTVEYFVQKKVKRSSASSTRMTITAKRSAFGVADQLAEMGILWPLKQPISEVPRIFPRRSPSCRPPVVIWLCSEPSSAKRSVPW